MVLLGERLKWMLVSFRLEIMLILTQNRCTVYAKRTMGSEIIFDAPDGTPRWCGLCRILFRYVWRQCKCRCKIGARFASNVPKDRKWFSMHPMELLGDVGHVESLFFPLQIVFVSIQDRCIVCARHSIGSDIVLDTPDGTTRWCGKVDARFVPFGDSANLDAR